MPFSRVARSLALCLCCGTTVFAAACGSSSSVADSGAPPPLGPVSCPDTGDLQTAATILPERLPDEATLRRWQEAMVDLGPRITGSPAHKAWHEFMVGEFEAAGLSVQRDPVPLEWWDHQTYRLTLIDADGAETAIPVASYYPYSGFTPEGGITAELVNAGLGLPQDFLLAGGKIAFYEENMLPLTAALFYATTSYLHDPDNTLTPLTPYRRASVSFLTPQEQTSLTAAAAAGVVGAIISYEASAENAEGQYTPFLTSPAGSQGVPALYVDRKTGDMIKARIAQGASARLELTGVKHLDDATEDIIATLPGSNPDEVIIVNTHSDGTSAAQENGTLGVVALARYFASLPLSCRQRTMIFTLNPGHFHSGINGDTQRFIDNYPDIIAKAVGSLTLEHLGQTEWIDDIETGLQSTGLVEPAAFYGSQNLMQDIMRSAVIAEDLRRTFVARPLAVIYFGVGSPLNARGVPNAAFIAGPNMMLASGSNQHLDKVDYTRMAAEIRTATRIAVAMDAAAKPVLCIGMIPQSVEPTGCTVAAP